MNETEVLLYWIYVAVMASGAITFAVWSRNRKGVSRVEYLIAFMIPTWSGLAYMSMALGQGHIIIGGEIVYVARYLDWVVTTPLLLTALALTAMHYLDKKDGVLIAALIIADVIMILTGLIADLSTGWVRLTWYFTGVSAFIVILWLIWVKLRLLAKKQGRRLYNIYCFLALYLTVFWISYPVAWYIGPSGMGYVGQTTDTFLFVTLPMFSKVGYSLLDLFLLRRLNSGGGAKGAGRVRTG
ncbi:lactococcin [Alteribacter lacisalsi]|uniref:Lactococcin n=1 Tax=Alteribacter lacisalsi TaxID=2045244 RepID=A0A2W0HIA8_9BACI|nr:bacteriorhodopsin [Alteribacter lacisalsi]PYZ96712.1 lactococcin [Alteribacter lacisalsi]